MEMERVWLQGCEVVGWQALSPHSRKESQIPALSFPCQVLETLAWEPKKMFYKFISDSN